MTQPGLNASFLAEIGLSATAHAYVDLGVAQLCEEALRRGEAVLGAEGPLIAHTGAHTGRAAQDRYVVRDGETEGKVHFAAANQAMTPDRYAKLKAKVLAHLGGREVFVQQRASAADPSFRVPVTIVTERAWHNLFARNMFLARGDAPMTGQRAITVLHAPTCKADPATDGTRSPTFVVLDLASRTVIIGGTEYAGEIKKSVFSTMNYLLPQRDVLPMHCSTNVGQRGDVALFFGLSGTGKTTLSADPDRALVGDDEHGWSPSGVFNLEGGCYAKVIRLSPEAEPEIYATTRRFGTVLENVVYDERSRALDLDADTFTENTRASYPLDQIPRIIASGQAGVPQNVVFLTCDAFAVLPPISRLTTAQAMYHFLSGYTAKVAGTEMGVTEPKATFSTCFGAPFMPLHPGVYAKLLGERLTKSKARAWLINTGWSGGPFGVGRRIKIGLTRAMVRAALSGALDEIATAKDATFGFEVPQAVPGVPESLLHPRETWADKSAYDAQRGKLARMFIDNFEQYKSGVGPEVIAVAPKP